MSGRPQEIFIDEHCIGCKYYADIMNYIYYCSYYEKEDKLRPCPPGKDCTERKERRGKDG